MDFLFASQDASTASLTWCCSLMADHPEMLARVRAEQEALRPHNEPVTADMLAKMTYTRQASLAALLLAGGWLGGSFGASDEANSLVRSLITLPSRPQVILEVLRFRPPATMVPQVAAVPFKVSQASFASRAANL